VAEYLMITGMSGAGRSQAGATMEDLGWYVIDNMPSVLITNVADLVTTDVVSSERLALVMGRSAGQLEDFRSALDKLQASGRQVRVLYLEASDEVLVRRFEGTRRRHPIAGETVSESIRRERDLLRPIRELADLVIDTSELNVHQLRDRLLRSFGGDDPDTMQISLLSFGFKHGVPLDVDDVLDCRFLPNPHWIDELRPMTGLDEPVRAYVLEQPATSQFLDKLDDLFGLLLPAYIKEGKSYLTIGIGCTGGRHRSVVMVQELATRMRRRGFDPAVQHRDISR
jgi:RNase adapter protein RapZ